MSRIGLAALLLVVALLTQAPDPLPAGGAPESNDWRLLQGGWEIVSVTRDGTADPTRVGETVTFLGDKVWFLSGAPRLPSIASAMG